MGKTILRCPHCKGQFLQIHKELLYHQHYTIENNKLYKLDKEYFNTTDIIWIHCIKCSQDEDIKNAEWKASKEETEIILNMILEPQSADITKYMTER